MRKNILEYLEDSALRVPSKAAFSNGEETMSFSETERAARSVGTSLLRTGVFREAVICFMDKHPRTLAAFFGVIYAGCFYVCIDPTTPRERALAIIENLSARVVITTAKSEKKALELGLPLTLRYEEISEVEPDGELLSEVRRRQIDTDPIYVVFTSGSTGVPKGVVAAHRSVIDYTESLCSALGFSERTVFGNQTPLYFDAPLKEIMPTLYLGATTYFIPKTLFMFPVRLIEYGNVQKVTIFLEHITELTIVSHHDSRHRIPFVIVRLKFGKRGFRAYRDPSGTLVDLVINVGRICDLNGVHKKHRHR